VQTNTQFCFDDKDKNHLETTHRTTYMKYTMKFLSSFYIVLCLWLIIGSTDAQSTTTKLPHDNNGGDMTFPLPDFTMQLLVDEPNVKPKPFQWPLITTTSLHLSSYMISILQQTDTTRLADSTLTISLHTIPSIDNNAATTFPNSTVMKADFVGNVHFGNDNKLAMSQTKVNEMVNQAFEGSVLQDLWDNFQQDSTLRQIKNLKVWVIINDDISQVNVETSRGTTTPNVSNNDNNKAPLKIASLVTIMVLVLVFSIGSFAYLRHLRARQNNTNGVNSKGSGLTEESLEVDDDRSVFSSEYWKDAWAQAATQVKPRPRRRQRQFKRQPSSVRPNLDSIVEEEEEEEEEDWDESSWAIEDALDGAHMNGSGENVDSDEEEASAISPLALELEMDAQASCSSKSSAGSFFKDDDPEIMAGLSQRQSGCFPSRGRHCDVFETSAISPRALELDMDDAQSSCSSQSSAGSVFKDEDPEIMADLYQRQSGCFPGRGRRHRDLEMQMMTTPKPPKSSLCTLKQKDSDGITLARNKELAKMEKLQVKPTVAEELEAVRKRMLLKERQEKKEEPVLETNELAMVHKRVLAKKEQEKKEPEVVTDELTMMRNRILNKSQHGKESRNDEII
jgi:hypothetical protein